jgi:hypothetical protein
VRSFTFFFPFRWWVCLRPLTCSRLLARKGCALSNLWGSRRERKGYRELERAPVLLHRRAPPSSLPFFALTRLPSLPPSFCRAQWALAFVPFPYFVAKTQTLTRIFTARRSISSRMGAFFDLGASPLPSSLPSSSLSALLALFPFPCPLSSCYTTLEDGKL